jgi:hypothetical protein
MQHEHEKGLWRACGLTVASRHQPIESNSNDDKPCSHLIASVDVDDQYIAILALWIWTTPVPWDATCESRLLLHHVTHMDHVDELHYYCYQRHPQMHYNRAVRHFHIIYMVLIV